MPDEEKDAVYIEEAGKGSLDDEVLPNEGEPLPQPDEPDDAQPDTAGKHGDMAVESGAALDGPREESE